MIFGFILLALAGASGVGIYFFALEVFEKDMLNVINGLLLLMSVLAFLALLYGGINMLFHARNRNRALKTEPRPVQATIARKVVRAVKSNDNYYIRISTPDGTWHAIIWGSRAAMRLAGKERQCRAWFDPVSGIPMLVEMEGVKFKPVPKIVEETPFFAERFERVLAKTPLVA